MSEENVEIVRALIETFNRGDLEALRSEVDPEIEWHDQPELPGATVHRGVEDTFAHLRSALRDLPGYRIDAEEFLDAGDVVVLCGRISAGHTRENPACGRTTRRAFRARG